ncbi:MAG TPA: hypothetical protein VER33_12495 [Polyangiaceae bacterium]|nr:hypothetical protein [Polyangiaceae bacterium]
MSDPKNPLFSPEAPPPEVKADPAELAPEASVTGEPPPKKRKKKRKAAPLTAAVGERSELDEQGRERPPFLLRFPVDAALEELIEAFERGNYKKVRELAPGLIARSERAEVQAAARELLRRIEPDPLLKFLLFASMALFVAVVAYVYYAHH